MIKNICSIIVFLFVVLAGCPQVLFASDDVLYVGVLESRSTNWPDWPMENDQELSRKVRVLFFKKANNWSSLETEITSPIYPKKVNWLVAFNGKCLGRFKSSLDRPPHKIEWALPRDTFHKPITNSLPLIGEPTEEFSGWLGGHYPRPLVAVSSQNCSDPQKWKPFKPDTESLKLVIPVFRKYLVDRKCPGPLQDKYFTPLKTYKSSDGHKLIQLTLKDDGKFRKESYWKLVKWFSITPEQEVRSLSTMVDSKYIDDEFADDYDSNMNLIDTGDYDSDGKSEVIFWVSRYDRDGYILFYDNFAHHVEFGWAYH
jgi:hypothetical protein